MDIRSAEIEIAAFLAGKLGEGYDVLALPEKQSDYEKPFLKGRLTVAFAGEKPEMPQSTFQVSQHVKQTYTISVQSRFLNSMPDVFGIGKLCDKVKAYLIGYQPTDGGLMYYVNHEFVRYEGGVWEHAIDFETKTLRVQEDNLEEETGAPLSSVSLNETFV
ncbi:MAG: Gp37 family protein [Chitinophagaceae bacterium]|nr:Gp37 family protein [Chitinophagaceae bacterium]